MREDAALLLAEYEINVGLWKHDDSLRQQRISNFLTLNTGLLVGLGLVLGIEIPNRWAQAITTASFVLFGVIVAIVWHYVLRRNLAYIRLRRNQLRSIEARLRPLSTFGNTHRELYLQDPVDFEGVADPLRSPSTAPSAPTEGLLPTLVGVLWVAVGISLGIAASVS